MTSRLMLVLIAIALFAVGCGGSDEPAADTAVESGDVGDAGQAPAPTQEAVDQVEAHHAASGDGRFEAVWPSGCARKRTRTVPSKRFPGSFALVEVTCERSGDADRGCKVTVYNELTDGGVPTPADVTRTFGEVIAGLGLEIRRQGPIERHGVTGVRAVCGEAAGPRQVWMEGFIIDGHVLMIMAWDIDDRLYGDPEISAFFESVVLTG